MSLSTEDPWPKWVLRFISSDDEQAFWDAVWSVGGSPPYGGVSFDEAEVVYKLLESFRGPGMADPNLYNAVREFVKNDTYRSSILDLFHINDAITSDPENYTDQLVDQGLTLSQKIEHDGMYGTFLCYKTNLLHHKGDIEGAFEANMRALQLFLALADKDTVYAERTAQCAQNAVALKQLSGDEEGARQLYEKLGPILDGF